MSLRHHVSGPPLICMLIACGGRGRLVVMKLSARHSTAVKQSGNESQCEPALLAAITVVQDQDPLCTGTGSGSGSGTGRTKALSVSDLVCGGSSSTTL